MPGPSMSDRPKGMGDELRQISRELHSLRQATEKLKLRRGRVIVAHIQAGHSYAEIAEQCGLSRGRIAQIVSELRA